MPACRYMEENGLVVMLAAQRLAGVALEVNFREHVTCTPMSSMNKPGHSGFKTHKKDLCPPKDFLKS